MVNIRMSCRGHNGGLLAIAAARNGKMVAAGFSDGIVRIWKQGNPMPEYTLRSHGAPVRSVVFSPNEKSLAAAYGDGTLALWRTEDGQSIRTLPGSGGRWTWQFCRATVPTSPPAAPTVP